LASIITKVITPFGSGSLSTTVPVDLSGASGETIAIGFDANQQLRVAALVSSGQTVFSADTTAMTLARLASADIDSTESETAIESAIRSAESYPTLVSEIAKDLQSGVAPLSDATVASDLVAVLSDVVPKVAAKSAARLSAKALDPPPVTALPYTVFAGPPWLKGLQLYATGNKDLLVTNGTLIPWSVETSFSTSPVMLPAQEAGVSIPMPNYGFNLTVLQDTAAGQELITELTVGLFKAALLFAPERCINSVLVPVVQENVKPLLTNPASFQEFVNVWKTQVSGFDSAHMIAQCAKEATTSVVTAEVTAILEVGASILADLSDVPEAIGATSTAATLWYEKQAWDHGPYTVGVCGTYDYQVKNCTASFSASPPSLTMAPGATALVTYDASPPSSPSATNPSFSALDGSGQPTVTPGDLSFQPIDSSVAAVTPSSQGYPYPPSFTVTAGNNPGGPSTTISIKDPSTGAQSAPLTVTVVSPAITPASQTVVSGTQQTVSFTLTDANGQSIILPSGVSWTPTGGTTSFDSSTLQPVSTTGAMGSWVVSSQIQPGTIDITAYGPNGASYGTATIVVAAPNSGNSSLSGTVSGSLLLTYHPGLIGDTQITFVAPLSDNQVVASPAPVFSTALSKEWPTSGWTLMGYPYTGTCLGDGTVSCSLGSGVGVPTGTTLLKLAFGYYYNGSLADECDIAMTLAPSGGTVIATAVGVGDPLVNAPFRGTNCDDFFNPPSALNGDVTVTWTPSQ